LIYASILVVTTPSNVFGQSTPEPLSVRITSSVTEGVAPATFEFGTSISGGQGPYSINWDFGDGTTASGQANTQHTFEADGTYDVWVGVTDANNVVADDIVQVVVTPQQPDVQNPNAGDSNFQPFDPFAGTFPQPIADMFPLIVLAAIVVIGGIALGKSSKSRNRGRRLRIPPSAVVDIHTKGGTRE
jgi:PKD repeat protein